MIWRLALASWLAVAISWFALGERSHAQFNGCPAGFCSPSQITSVASSLTYKSDATSAATTGTIDYGTMSYGSGCTRVIAAVAEYETVDNPPNLITSVTINGASLSGTGASARTSGNHFLTDIWYGAPTSSSGDVQIVWGSAPAGFSAVFLYCLVTTTPTVGTPQTGAASSATSVATSSPLVVPAGGFGVAVTGVDNGNTVSSWVNATQDATIDSNIFYAAHTVTGSITITANFSGSSNSELSTAPWSP
jgi:hypothetical protein